MIVIEDAILQNASVSEEQIRMEIAALLYERQACSLRKAASVMGVSWMALQKFLGGKGISVYTEKMLERDLEFARKFEK